MQTAFVLVVVVSCSVRRSRGHLGVQACALMVVE